MRGEKEEENKNSGFLFGILLNKIAEGKVYIYLWKTYRSMANSD